MDLTLVENQFKHNWHTTLLSLILFSGVTYFLVWTESQTIQTSLMLKALVSAAETVDVRTEDSAAAARYEGRVVHVVGPLRVLEAISEPDYDIQVRAVKLRKRVEMYQWIEEDMYTSKYINDKENFQTELGVESYIYWYRKVWRDYLVDSSLFYYRWDHENPTSMPIFSGTHIANNVSIGWLYLGLDVKKKVNDYSDYKIWSRPQRSDIKLHSGFYYHGRSAHVHEIGDLRVHFSYAGREDDIYTAVGVIESGVLQPYSPEEFPAAAADPIALLRKGSYSLAQLRDLEKCDANIQLWMYRLLGFVMVYASAMLSPACLTLFLQCQWISNSLRSCHWLWINLVLAFSYMLLVISVPWFIHMPSYGVLVACAAALPLLHYSTLFA